MGRTSNLLAATCVAGIDLLVCDTYSDVEVCQADTMTWNEDDTVAADARSSIFELVRENPGIRKSQIARALGMELPECLEAIREMRAEGILKRA